jgi:DNA-binding GntR family transcriptional regulator
MAIEKIDKQTLREKIYDALREQIILGEILPGQAVTLKDLSEKFDVSIIPVREALFQLESEGVIVRRTNRDYRVNTLNRRQFKEIYKIRFINEIYIARRAFRNRNEGLERDLRGILEELRISVGMPKTYVQKNHDFHFLVYTYGRMPILLEIINGLWARIGPYLTINAQIEDLGASFQNHQDMFDALAEGDEKRFVSILRKDIHFSYTILKPFIQRLETDTEEQIGEILGSGSVGS